MSEQIQDLVQHALDQDYNKANKIFNDVMTVKLTDVLDQEKVKMADQVYNGVEDPEDEEDEDQLELDLETDEESEEEEGEEESGGDDEEPMEDDDVDDEGLERADGDDSTEDDN